MTPAPTPVKGKAKKPEGQRGAASRSSGAARTNATRAKATQVTPSKPLLPFLASLVALLLAANLYFLLADPRSAAKAGEGDQPMIAAVGLPGLSPAPGQGADSAKGVDSAKGAAPPKAAASGKGAAFASGNAASANASTIEYSTDIDDLGGYSVIVNKSRKLSPDYAPSDLETPDVPFAKGKAKGQLRREAAQAYRSMQRAALAAGIKFDFYSGFRDYAYQDRIYNNSIKVYGQAWATAYSAPAGASEHQTGLAIDISCAETKDQLDESFAATPAGAWLVVHAPEYGFILRYPKGKEAATGYSYEPWHFRYLGHALARAVTGSGLILEEFMARSR